MTSDTSTNNSKTSKTSSDVKPPAKTDVSNDNSTSSNKDSAKNSPPARQTSYFSSVSTDEYREGWDTIFGTTTKKRVNTGRATVSTRSKLALPLSIKLSNEDLTRELNDLLKDAVRRRAKKDNLRIARLLNKAQIKWHLECTIAE